jgi:Fe-S-cluster containining protein
MGWERYLDFRCTGCGNCCRGTYLMVTDEDVRRIAKGTKRPIEDFVTFHPVEDINMGQRSPWGVKMSTQRKLMTVKWQRGGKCMFLGADERCTIYSHRPMVCRSHPFEVRLTETGGIDRMAMSRVVDCPAEWDGRTTRRDLGLLERASARESTGYLERVEAWNRSRSIPKRSPREFLRYVGLTE